MDTTPRTCAWCKRPMDGRRLQARTCSDRCRQHLSRQRRQQDAPWEQAQRYTSLTPERLFAIREARAGRGPEAFTLGAWWTCSCSRIVPLAVTHCPDCGLARPAPTLMQLMEAGQLEATWGA
jgi:hypothetical protein